MLHLVKGTKITEILNLYPTLVTSDKLIPVMAAIAVRKKVISVGHFSLATAIFSLVRLNQEQLYVLNALKIREK